MLPDLTVGLINVSTDIVWRITVAWHAGNVLCKLIRFLQAVVTYSSTYVLVALSIDRYDAITHPMNFSGSCRYLWGILLLFFVCVRVRAVETDEELSRWAIYDHTFFTPVGGNPLETISSICACVNGFFYRSRSFPVLNLF